MKKLFILSFLLVSLVTNAQIDKIVGRWNTIDDKTNKAKSLVEIYKGSDGLYYGKIEKLFAEDKKGALCVECEGADKNKPIEGMIIVRSMKYEDGQLKGGKVLDPECGSIYYCTITYDAENGTLKLRGSIDKRGWLGRTQTWQRAK